jgi:spore coat protein JB
MENVREVEKMDSERTCRDLMKRIRELDFAILETALFLNAYPGSKEALSYYNELRCTYEKLRAEYTEHCGPLTLYSNKSESDWDWARKPWPWELCAD